MAVIGAMHVCDDCGREFGSSANLGRHRSVKHAAPKPPPSAGPSSDAPIGGDDPLWAREPKADAEVPLDGGDAYIPPDGTPPPKVLRPKVADGLTPWLSLLGLAIYNRNHYDGQAISNGVPGFVAALDDVAQQNDAVYKLLEGIKLGDSPNFRLVVAALAIIAPILANHRPDSNGLRNVTGALKMMPGTNIPDLPPREGREETDTAADNFAGMAQDLLSQMPPDAMEQMAQAFDQMPDDVKQQMMEQAATMVGGMAHPDEVHGVSEPEG